MIPQSIAKKDEVMANGKDAILKAPRILSFDPTIHAGHLLTVMTIIACSIGAWYDVKSSVAMIKEENVQQEKELSRLRDIQGAQSEKMNDSISALALMNRQDMNKMRDDMTVWFMRISDKLDAKQDKKQ